MRKFSFHAPVLLALLSTPALGNATLALEGSGLKEFSVPISHDPQLSEEDKQFGRRLMSVMGNDRCPSHPEKCDEDLAKLDRLLAEKPSQSFLHELKALYLLAAQKGDLMAAISEIDTAITQSDAPGNILPVSVVALIQMRAKANFETEAYNETISDLLKGIRLGRDHFFELFDTGGTKPTEPGNAASLNGADFDLLVQKFPGDWKPLALRGLFKLSFYRFGTEAIGNSLGDLNEAMVLEPNDPLPKRFLAYAYEAAAFYEPDTKQQAMLYQRAIQFRKASIGADPKSFEDCAALGENFLHAGAFELAIEYYTHAITLDPQNASVLNGRGIAEKSVGKFAAAVQDFTSAILILQKRPKSESYLENNYENRAEVDLRLGRTSLAIDDYSSALGYQITQTIFLMSLAELRELYPEFADVPDIDLLEGLRAHLPQARSMRHKR